MLDAYYALRGWDADGVPTRERLTDLGLDAVPGVARLSAPAPRRVPVAACPSNRP